MRAFLNRFRKTWTVEIVGYWSGRRTEMSFMRFRTIEQARAWCDEKNVRESNDDCFYVPKRLHFGKFPVK